MFGCYELELEVILCVLNELFRGSSPGFYSEVCVRFWAKLWRCLPALSGPIPIVCLLDIFVKDSRVDNCGNLRMRVFYQKYGAGGDNYRLQNMTIFSCYALVLTYLKSICFCTPALDAVGASDFSLLL
jgi:hypothetical protein